MSFFGKFISQQSSKNHKGRTIDREQKPDDSWVNASEYWNINNGKYLDALHGKTIRQKSKLAPRYVNFNMNKNEKIAQDLCRPQWSNMKALYLMDNRIKSVECLIHMDAPHLVCLDLRGNQITRFQSARKFSFKLQSLELLGNPMMSWKGLAEIDCVSQQQRSKKPYADLSIGTRTLPSLKCHDFSEWAKSKPRYLSSYLSYHQSRILSLVPSSVVKSVLEKHRDDRAETKSERLRRNLDRIEEEISVHQAAINRLLARRDELRQGLLQQNRRLQLQKQ